MKRYKYLLIFLLLSTVSLFGQNNVRFVIDLPNGVTVGQRFHLTYILEGGKGREIEVPENIEGFDVLYGPALSQSSIVSIINGQMTSKTSESYTYTLEAKKEGTFTMPVAAIVVDGKHYKSNTKSIKVLPVDRDASSQQNRQQGITSSTSTAEKISSDDVFIRAIFSKTQVNEQEPVVVTFRLYSALNITNITDVKFPEFEGFLTEDFDSPINLEGDAENYKGKNYITYDIKRSLLLPQRSGKLTIPAGSISLVLRVPSGRQVQTFFGPQTLMTETKKTVQTSPVVVNVSKLPDGKPLGFSGGVGAFNVKTSITSQKIKANEAITLKLDISGTGNMKLIKNPEMKLPKEFEIYDPKVSNNFKVTANGYLGTKSVEYLFIPRYPGKYTIPGIEFSYFDTATRKYKTINSSPYTIEVDRDPNAGTGQSATSYISQQAVKVDLDIRYLKTKDINWQNYTKHFTGSLANWLWYIIPLLLLTVAIIVNRKQIKANADIARMKTRKANKIAIKRLKQAGKYLKDNEKDKFYEESLRAVWGYLSDKLTIPVSELNRENIEVELRTYGVKDDLIRQFIGILDTCEFARYAPSESHDAMDKLYAEMLAVIGEMENVIKIK